MDLGKRLGKPVGYMAGNALATALWQHVLDICAGGSVFTAERVTVIGGKVSAWIDWLDPTHTLAQSSGLAQSAEPAAHADFNGQLCVTFTGAQFYDSSRAASAWDYLSNGTGCEYFHVVTVTTNGATDYTVHTTNNILASTTEGGSFCDIFGSGGSNSRGHAMIISNGSSTPANGRTVNSAVNTGGVQIGSPTYLNGSFGISASPRFVERIRRTTFDSGSSVGGQAGAAHTLRIGKNWVGTGFPLFGRLAASFFVPRVLTSTERNTIQNYLTYKYGFQ